MLLKAWIKVRFYFYVYLKHGLLVLNLILLNKTKFIQDNYLIFKFSCFLFLNFSIQTHFFFILSFKSLNHFHSISDVKHRITCSGTFLYLFFLILFFSKSSEIFVFFSEPITNDNGFFFNNAKGLYNWNRMQIQDFWERNNLNLFLFDLEMWFLNWDGLPIVTIQKNETTKQKINFPFKQITFKSY